MGHWCVQLILTNSYSKGLVHRTNRPLHSFMPPPYLPYPKWEKTEDKESSTHRLHEKNKEKIRLTSINMDQMKWMCCMVCVRKLSKRNTSFWPPFVPIEQGQSSIGWKGILSWIWVFRNLHVCLGVFVWWEDFRVEKLFWFVKHAFLLFGAIYFRCRKKEK